LTHPRRSESWYRCANWCRWKRHTRHGWLLWLRPWVSVVEAVAEGRRGRCLLGRSAASMPLRLEVRVCLRICRLIQFVLRRRGGILRILGLCRCGILGVHCVLPTVCRLLLPVMTRRGGSVLTRRSRGLLGAALPTQRVLKCLAAHAGDRKFVVMGKSGRHQEPRNLHGPRPCRPMSLLR
jgi:hypothetical protein